MQKICSKCGRTLDDSMFYKNRKECKECCKKRVSGYYKKAPVTYSQDEYGRLVSHTGKARHIYLSGNMASYIKRNYANTPNTELSEYVGVSVRTLRRYAKAMNLEKSEEFMRKCRLVSGLSGGISTKKKYSKNSKKNDKRK